MPAIPALLLALQAIVVQPESGEVHLRHVRQLTFGGQNAEAYFAASGRLLIFQRHGPAESCDQMYVMGVEGTGLWASNRNGKVAHETNSFVADWIEGGH